MKRTIARKEPSNKLLPSRKGEASSAAAGEKKRTYLRVGDKVFHKKYKSWGYGIVVETKTSDIPGGLCFVRILFQDGKGRVFDNSFASTSCCYYTGVTLLNRVEL
jgi:hypothetical protein